MAEWVCEVCDYTWTETGHPDMKCPKCGSDKFSCIEDCTDYYPTEIKIKVSQDCCGIKPNPEGAVEVETVKVKMKGEELAMVAEIIATWLPAAIKQDLANNNEFSGLLDPDSLGFDDETTKLAKLVEENKDVLLKYRSSFTNEFWNIVEPYLGLTKGENDVRKLGKKE